MERTLTLRPHQVRQLAQLNAAAELAASRVAGYLAGMLSADDIEQFSAPRLDGDVLTVTVPEPQEVAGG